MRKEYASLRRRTFLTPLWLTAFVWLGVLGVLGWVVLSASTTTVLVLRHAEKLDDGTKDPPLSAAGQARAERLARLLAGGADGRIEAVFATQFRRTQLTAAPVAARLGLPVEVVPADRNDLLLQKVLREHRGGRVLIVGHSNTVPEIVARLSGQAAPLIGENDYGDLFVVAVPRFSRPSWLRLTLE